ncbi:patatin-like phospholipase [Herbihabitans rhizosphaerae]|uniref:Patatin-like phospholipase n=1 Tax=Herbihabitans rhizosphaerae TaxID=1872711 RepID=A0A4Q7L3K8_9PSEU|nr:patatin-like phospholipase family protein [Herbihabitans rhizosphaerae]RZS44169.1 patatin-like phospholipase [Herbihabitans rhizosphaerae]
MTGEQDPHAALRGLRLTEDSKYRKGFTHDWVRLPPNEADRRSAEAPETYRLYANTSCDLTMRGGTTSGVIYPLAVCALAERYVFRSVGGASAGAIAASVTAAAEFGRFVEEPENLPEGAVRPGFSGLASVVEWLSADGDGSRWRLAQLFQPSAAQSRAYRVVTASMQDKAATGRGKLASIVAALLAAVTPLANVALLVLFLAWLVGPLVQQRFLMPTGVWDSLDAGLRIGLGAAVIAFAVVATVWTLRISARLLPRATAALCFPLVGALAGMFWWSGGDGHEASAYAWVVSAAAGALWWLAFTFLAVAVYAAVYGKATWPMLADGRRFRFGLIPGAEPYQATWVDRLAGMATSTGVPPLSIWLADVIDDLAGLPRDENGRHTRALTFGDLWCGPTPQEGAVALDGDCPSGERVINLALMTTDLSGGRPYRLPFLTADGEDEQWQLCRECLRNLVPDRIIDQMIGASTGGTTAFTCPTHPDQTLHRLPQPWEMPVLLATRMSLALPGLICAVPLCRNGKVHWFSDGGITSNFPIHFFDTLLPRWPTFGLNLQPYPPDGPRLDVLLPKQDATPSAHPWDDVGGGMGGFVGAILNTFLGWRDTMQAALPGFRGRIANVRQKPGEGGTNLFMTPDTIARLALRGHEAGTQLRERFTSIGADGEADTFTQTDRYRWIRMRIAMREYGQLARQADARAPLYRHLAENYQVPEELSDWFRSAPGAWPAGDPHAAEIIGVFDGLGDMATTTLSENFDGTSPIDPVLRLTAPE